MASPIIILLVDIYMAQHPGYSTAAGRRSVAGHLVGLCCVLELSISGSQLSCILAGLFPEKQDIRSFEPVPWLGEVTVASVHATRDLEEHNAWARIWPEAVWRAWSPHHARVHDLLAKSRG